MFQFPIFPRSYIIQKLAATVIPAVASTFEHILMLRKYEICEEQAH